MTVQQFHVNALFIKSNIEYSASRLTFRNGKPVIEKSVKALIDRCAEDCNAQRIIVAGSSMGGFCALYYGLKYNWDIIAGAPPYSYKSLKMLLTRQENLRKTG